MVCVNGEIKKKEILTFVTTWMGLEGLMLSEVSQTRKGKYCITSHVESKQTRSTDTRHRMDGSVVARVR